jgi:sigma-E factor negative regulatory protein RseC
MEQQLISHKGIISEIDRETIRVSIIVESACASCHAKGMCTIADTAEKVIEVRNRKPGQFKVGDNVQVAMKKSLGLKAVFYGYLLPFLVLLFTLLLVYESTGSEATAGSIALLILFPYYFGLYMLRDRLKARFEFDIYKPANFN